MMKAVVQTRAGAVARDGGTDLRFLRKAFVLLLITSAFLWGGLTPALARDLPRTDPDRAQILDAARQVATIGTDQTPESIKWVVRDLFRDGDLAYFCAARMTDGQIARTDEAVDGYLFGLKRIAGAWSVVAETGNFLSAKAKPSDCWYEGQPIQSRATIARFLREHPVDVAQLKAQSRQNEEIAQTYLRIAKKAAAPKGGWLIATQQQALDLAAGVLDRHHLTTVKPECLGAAVAGDDAAYYLVEFDLRNSAACKGPRRLFAIAIDRATGRMTTDAAHPNGPLQPIE